MSLFPLSISTFLTSSSKTPYPSPYTKSISLLKHPSFHFRQLKTHTTSTTTSPLSPQLSPSHISTSPSSYINLHNIDMSICNSFQNVLTISNIKSFSMKIWNKHIEMKLICPSLGNCLRKHHIVSIIKSTFPNDSYTNELIEMIWNRFRLQRCEIKSTHRKNENYFLNEIQSQDEVDIYDIVIGFACFAKCEVSLKIKLLFELSDCDNDGYITQYELKKMINTLYSLFSQEVSEVKLTSGIIYHSIGKIKAFQILNSLLKTPGELYKIFNEEHVISFEQFLTALQKIQNYQYVIFPFFVNFFHFLQPKITETNFHIKPSNYITFANNSNAILNHAKSMHSIINGNCSLNKMNLNRTGCMNNNNNEFKKHLEPLYRNSTERNFSFFKNKKPTFINAIASNTKKNLKLQTEFINEYVKPVMSSWKSSKNIKEDYYEVLYSRINNMEVLPGKINVIDNNNVVTECESTNASVGRKSAIKKGNIKKLNINTSRYMTYNEVLNEIKAQMNKHKVDELGNEELNHIRKDIVVMANKTKKRLKNKNPFQNLMLDRVKYHSNKK